MEQLTNLGFWSYLYQQDTTIKFYIKQGARRDKLVLGIPTYGRSYTLINPDAHEIGSPTDGPGEKGLGTKEDGYLAYYEVHLLTTNRYLDDMFVSMNVDIICLCISHRSAKVFKMTTGKQKIQTQDAMVHMHTIRKVFGLDMTMKKQLEKRYHINYLFD